MSDELKPCSMCGWPAEQMWDPEEQIIRCTNKDSFCHNALYGVYYNEWQNRPIEDALRAERDALAAMVKKYEPFVLAIGYLTPIVPDMEIDVNNPMGMAEKIYAKVQGLAAEVERLREVDGWIVIDEYHYPEEYKFVQVDMGFPIVQVGFWAWNSNLEANGDEDVPPRDYADFAVWLVGNDSGEFETPDHEPKRYRVLLPPPPQTKEKS